LPWWWKSHQAQAQCKALHFAAEVGKMSDGYQAVTERKLQRVVVTLPSGRTLPIGGRPDLLLIPAPGLGVLRRRILVDFKTGADSPLKGTKSLLRFEGIQLGLYLKALESLEEGAIDAGYMTSDEAWSSQLTSEDINCENAVGVLERLAWMQDEGVFGWTGIVRDPYSAACTYPMATLAPVVNISAKFVATHSL
jgi:hypothetical protein